MGETYMWALKTITRAFARCLILSIVAASAWPATAPDLPGADDRYKADILLVIAHSDDETWDVAGYLARAIYDQHRRVAVIIITRNDGEAQEGDNGAGPELGQAMGAEREIEARQALAFLGVTNVWFLNAPNTASGQNVLRSLESWNHGSILGQVVRLIRLTRPDVILTMLPAYVAGENHSDHQAAGVIATEAFDMAGTSAAFGEQVAAAPEGLHPWQPKKLYFFSDSFEYPYPLMKHLPLPSPFRGHFLEGHGPVYSNAEISTAKQVPYSVINARESAFYLTQDGKMAVEAIEKHDFKGFNTSMHFIFGKSLVGGSTTGDIFNGIVPGPLSLADEPSAPAPQQIAEPALELGGPWHYYREFWRAHHIEHLAALLPIAETAIAPGDDSLYVPLLICNNSKNPQTVTLSALLPQGWSGGTGFSEYRLMPGETYPVQAILGIPDPARPRWQEIKWQISVGGQQRETVILRVYVGARGAMPEEKHTF